MSKLEKLSFNDVLKWHALAAGPAGLVLVMLPHRLFAQLSGAPYSPAAHEVAPQPLDRGLGRVPVVRGRLQRVGRARRGAARRRGAALRRAGGPSDGSSAAAR